MIAKTSSLYAAVLSMLVSACMEPQDCSNGKCAKTANAVAATNTATSTTATATSTEGGEKSVLKPAGDGQKTATTSSSTGTDTSTESNTTTDTNSGTSTQTATTTATNSGTGSTTSDSTKPIDASEAEVKQSLTVVDTKLSALSNDNSDSDTFDELYEAIASLRGLTRSLTNARDAKITELTQVQQLRQQETANLVAQLVGLANQRQATRLQKMRELENLELAILDPLTPEGTKAQIEWDQFFAKLDIVRELSVTSEIMATQTAMLDAVDKMYVADKNVLKQIVQGIIGTNLALVQASAPANALLILEKLAALEAKLGLAVGAGDMEQITWLTKQLEANQQRIKLPLDVIDPTIFTKVVSLLALVKTAEGTVAALNQAIAKVDELIDHNTTQLNSYKKSVKDSRIDALSLWPLSIRNAANRGRVYVGLEATSKLIELLKATASDIEITVNKLARANITKGFPQDILSALSANEAKFGTMVTAIRTTLANLNVVTRSIKTCTADKAIDYDYLSMQILHCDTDVDLLYTVVK